MEPAYRLWRCGKDYQVIDLEAGQALLFVSGNHRLLRISSETGQRLRQGPHALRPEEVAEWNQLAHCGVISASNLETSRRSAFGDGANLAINVNLTAACNLGCTYCFADGGDYGRIRGGMGSETVEDIFRFVKRHVTATQTVRFEFFGGEPLLNLGRIQEVCRRAEETERDSGIRFIHRISTNLTVLPPAAVELFADKSFVVSVSIDGAAETHDRNRPTKKGDGSFATIIDNCRRVRAAGDNIVLVARMTVVGGPRSMIENVRALWRLNLFDYFQIYPGVVPAEKAEAVQLVQLSVDGPVSDAGPSRACGNSNGTAMYAGFLAEQAEFARLYGEFFSPDNRFRGALEYERIVDMVLEGKAALSFCSAGRNYFTFSPDDSIMPCHRLVGDVGSQVGDARRGLDAEKLAPWRAPVDRNPVCSQCWVRYICAGGCRQENLIATGSIDDPNPEGCDYQRQLVSGVVATLARQGPEYRRHSRGDLDDLFVSCGRPVVMNRRRDDAAALRRTKHFGPL